MKQFLVMPHWNAPVAGTWQGRPTKSQYELKTGRPTMFPNTYLLMPNVSKGSTCTIFHDLWYVAAGDRIHNLLYRRWTLLPLRHLGRCVSRVCLIQWHQCEKSSISYFLLAYARKSLDDPLAFIKGIDQSSLLPYDASLHCHQRRANHVAAMWKCAHLQIPCI